MRHSAEDLALLDRLRVVLGRLDPVPEHVYRAAYAARAPIAGERLVSVVDSPATELAGVRGSGDRVLRFTGDQLCVQLMLCPLGSGELRMLGVLSPEGGHHEVTACWPEGSVTSEVEAHGRFLVSSVPCGPLRLQIDDVARTEWFLG